MLEAIGAVVDGHKCLPNGLRGLFRGIAHLHSKDGVTFHSLRHTMASLALNHGVSESTVQRMGNWKTRTMVARGAHLADERRETRPGPPHDFPTLTRKTLMV